MYLLGQQINQHTNERTCEQATAMLYEQGGLNHDMSFFLTAVAFYSLERPEVKVNLLEEYVQGGAE